MTKTWPWVCSLSLATSGTLKSPIEGLLWLWSELSELWARLSVRQMSGENAAPSNVAANVTARIAFIFLLQVCWSLVHKLLCRIKRGANICVCRSHPIVLFDFYPC